MYSAPPRATAHVAGVKELEQTRDTLITKLSEAQKAAEQRARREGEVRLGQVPTDGPLASAKSWWSERGRSRARAGGIRRAEISQCLRRSVARLA